MDTEAQNIYNRIHTRQVRLLKFLPDDERTSIVFEVHSVDGPMPSYRALSYSWASDDSAMKKSWTMKTTKGDLPILDSLQSFVQVLKSRKTMCDGRWWIDYLCINQADLVERAEQVSLMQQVYDRAHEVIVWLGEQSSDSDRAFNFIKLHDKIIQEANSDERIRKSFDLQTEKYTAHWKALENLLSRKWWSRVWTIQEFVISRILMFWCGLQEASKAAVCNSIAVADKCTSVGIKETIAFRYGLNRKRVWNLYEAQMKGCPQITRTLLSIAEYFCFMDVTDDRDRLYGMIAMATDGSSLLNVDYSLTCEGVYLRFAQAFIRQHRSLDIICFATIHKAIPGSSLPSWVPDWHWKNTYHVTPLMVSQSHNDQIGNLRSPRYVGDGTYVHYSASKSKIAIYEFNHSQLLVQGVVVDTVDGISASKGAPFVQSSDQDLPFPVTSCTEILKRICQALVLNRKDRFLRYPMPAEEFFYDFIRLCRPLLRVESTASTLTALREWFQRTRFLRIQGRTFDSILGDHYQTSIDLSGPAPNNDEFVLDSFIGRFFDTVIRLSLRLMVTQTGRIGMVSEQATKGDLICVLYGYSVPVLLRKASNGEEFFFVGERFLENYMNGQTLDQTEFLGQTFCLQ
ncbi:hypothetical protein IG631_15690 [Alternaria alternata]|nr:hypothetical protein IG631_15690 [Alternaria alternata]